VDVAEIYLGKGGYWSSAEGQDHIVSSARGFSYEHVWRSVQEESYAVGRGHHDGNSVAAREGS
jgi:hypothetical protein